MTKPKFRLVPYTSDMMLQCERQGVGKPAGFYNRLRESDDKKTCGSAAS
ncbi:hypothetical protein [Mesorhizobium sp.]|nr:hypothetical protein [Mesorhizobium sp.]